MAQGSSSPLSHTTGLLAHGLHSLRSPALDATTWLLPIRSPSLYLHPSPSDLPEPSPLSLGLATGFGQWHASKQNASRGLESTCIIRLALPSFCTSAENTCRRGCWRMGCMGWNQVPSHARGKASLDQLAASPLQDFERAQLRPAEPSPEQLNPMDTGAE